MGLVDKYVFIINEFENFRWLVRVILGELELSLN